MKRTLSPLLVRSLSLAIVMTLCLTVGAQTSTTIPHTLLWRITGKGLTKPSYLYGTMHLNDQRLFQFGDSVYRAIETSEGLAIEVNPDEMAAYMVNKMFDKLDGGKKLEDILDPAWFEAHKKELAKRFNKRAEDIRASDVVKEKNKWMSEYIEKGEMPTFMDAWLYNTARRQGKWLGGIEDIGDQADVLDDLVDQTDVNNLLGSDEDMTSSKMRPTVDRMIEVYSAQDLERLQVMMNVQTSAKEKDALLIRRNIKMARRMDSLSSLRTMFFAVGAAHLPGDSGVIDLLKKRGFTVEPVFSHKKSAAKDYTFKEVHLPWITVTGEDSTYSVQMPANPASVRLYGIVEMKFLMDLFNLAGYATSAIARSDRKENMDTLYNNVSRKMFQGKTIAPTRSLEKDGIHGREYIYYGHLSNVRVQIFMDEKMVYMSVLSSVKKEALTTADADKFFLSYTIHAHPVITSKVTAYTDSVMGVSFMTPANLVYNEKFSNKNDESWNIHCFSGMDRATGAVVFLFSKEMRPAYHIASMQRIYDDYDEVFNRDYDHLQKDSLWIDSLKLVGYRGENIANRGLFVNAIMVVRDGRQIILMVGTDSAGLTLPVLKKVSESFHFIDYLKRPWQQYSSPDQSFSFYGPAPVQPHIPKDDSYKMQWVSYDTSTATSYLIWPDTLGKYTWYSSDSAFWETYASSDTATQEEIWRKDIVNGDLPGREILTRDKTEAIRHYRRRVLISGDKVYKLISYGSRELMTSPVVNQFFEKFRIPTAAKPSEFTTDKTALLLRDLASGDSATQWKAYRAIDDAPFTRSDAPLLREALFHPYKNLYDTGYDDTFNMAIAKALADLHDTATTDFVRDRYDGLTGEKAYLRNIALYTLAKEQTAYSYEVLDKLLQQGPTSVPLGDELQAALIDSPELGIRVFPSLFRWVSDTLQGPGIGYIASRLSDSGWISKDSLKAMAGPFIACARALLPAIKATGTYEDGDLYYLLRVIGKVRTPAATALLRSYLAVKNNFLLDEVTKELLRRQQPVPPAVLLRLAKDLSYRSGLYDELKEQHKTALFPAPYRTAVLLGQGSVYTSAGYGNDDEEVDTVIYLAKRTATYQGKSYVFYLYKVRYVQGDDEGAGKTRLGIAGGFDPGGGVEPKKELTGIYYDEELDEKQVGAQLKAYLAGIKD